MTSIEVTYPSDGPPGKILKWRVTINTMVSAGRVLLLYHHIIPGIQDGKIPEKKLRATRFGRVITLLAKQGDILQPGQAILKLEGCTHPTVMKDLCAECGADLRLEESGKDGQNTTLLHGVPMLHSVPELKVCPELAEKIGKEDEQRLLNDRKLALLVDLDQTIVHTTNDDVPLDMKDVYHFQLYGPNSRCYHTRLRPNTRHFLLEMSKLYELHICTFGARNYAHTVASLLDTNGTLFSHRILSRDECFDPASKTANLKALFPCGDDMVCIIDDREDVWQGCGNLVQVKPYHFFRHTGDINAPPGLEKYDTPSFGKISCDNENEEQSNDNANGLITPTSEENTEMKEIESNEEIEEIGNMKLTSVNKEIQSPTEDSLETVDKTKEKEIDKHKDCFDEDDDDYLLYLEDILRRIHTEYYVDMNEDPMKKSLRDIIPRVRARVLKDLNLTFSSLIPTHQKLNQSRAYKVARSLGAEVTQDLTDNTTHLVALRRGTAKVNMAKKKGNIRLVNPDWLWTCAERWEHVDERLFPVASLESKFPLARGSRIPPPHCGSIICTEDDEAQMRHKFADSINPLMTFTKEDLAIMDKEVEEDMDDPDGEGLTFEIEENECFEIPLGKRLRNDDSESSNSTNDENNDARRKKRKSSNPTDDEDEINDSFDNAENDEDEDEDEEDPAVCFRRGQPIPDNYDFGDNSQDSIDDIGPVDNEDDREWNAMGAALEREFLSE